VKLLYGCDAKVAEWAGKQLNTPFVPPFVAIGVVDDLNAIVGAVIFNDYTGCNIEFTAVGRHAWTREIMQAIYAYPFHQLGVLRVTARTQRSNARVRRILPKLGFVFEGVQKKFYGKTRADDALVFALFPEITERYAQRKLLLDEALK
jgi:RimJ/RimL family protein N-acetyltransferase